MLELCFLSFGQCQTTTQERANGHFFVVYYHGIFIVLSISCAYVIIVHAKGRQVEDHPTPLIGKKLLIYKNEKFINYSERDIFLTRLPKYLSVPLFKIVLTVLHHYFASTYKYYTMYFHVLIRFIFLKGTE